MVTTSSGSRGALGVDACKKGWVGFVPGRSAYFGATIDDLVTAALADGPVAAVGIDIPIGLTNVGSREADRLARAVVGRRGSSVFTTPTRRALEAPTHAEANAINVELTGKGLSQQAYALRTKIMEVDAWARTAPMPVLEVHPEVSFATVMGRPLDHPKSTWAGVEERRAALRLGGIKVPADLGRAGEMAGVDDVLDAAVASWSVRRWLAGMARSFPDPPERFSDGDWAAIWA